MEIDYLLRVLEVNADYRSPNLWVSGHTRRSMVAVDVSTLEGSLFIRERTLAVGIFFGVRNCAASGMAWLAALAEAWLYRAFTGRIDPW